MNIVISNPSNFEKIKTKIIEQGTKKLHILADFDRTLTKAIVNNKKTPSIISILREENYLTEEYSKKAHALFEKYHPIEINHELSLKEKKKAMQKWWETHFKLLISYKLNKKHIEKAINSGKIELRKGVVEFLTFLHKKKIPLIILSSSGLGEDSIRLLLKKEEILFPNIEIISNSFNWNKKGNFIGIKKPIIHVMNKDETILEKFKFFHKIKNRKNVILLGDSLGDVGMIKGFKYNNLIKIGFLNIEVEKSLEKYKENFDVLILNDGNFDFVNNLIKNIK